MMVSTPFDEDYVHIDGCSACDGGGWKHGCCDDMCRHCTEPEDCDNAKPCDRCNLDGLIP